MILEKYLSYLNEANVITKASRAPCAAYEIVYGKKCPHRSGRYPGNNPQKNWNGLSVDEALEDKWLNDLSNIKEIEIRSSCAGHDKNWVSYIVFRATKKMDFNKVVSNLESDKITKASAHIGRGGQMRVVVASKTWYGQSNWKPWWTTLVSRIRKSL